MIYLDNAATTFPKPPCVSAEVSRCIREYCGNPGRGAHELSLKAAEKIFECRERISAFFGVGAPERVIFTLNTTHALNIAIKGLLHRGDHVIISDMEHNAVYRPVRRLADEGIVSFDVFKTHPTSDIVNAIREKLRPNTKMVICTHCPNLTSEVMPIRDIGHFCKAHGLLFVVDAAQSAGHVPIDLVADKIDALCLPGHKGLYGIQGCGALCLADRVLPDTLTEGGSGVSSLEGTMPELPPERYEAGTPPTPAIAALNEGIKFVSRLGTEYVTYTEKTLFAACRERLSTVPGLHVYRPECEGAVLLFNIDGLPSEHIAARLSRAGICVRGGYHCSALGHRTLGTERGGAVRISFGVFNKTNDADRIFSVLSEL